MANIFDRLAGGPGRQQDDDGQAGDWNQMVGSAPPEKFQQAASGAFRDLDPQEYYNHTQPGVGGTDPFGGLQDDERGGLAQKLMGALMGRGMGREDIGRQAGLNNVDPSRMSSGELAQLTQWTQRNHPEALGNVATEYRDKPNMLESLLGNKAIQMAAIGLGAKILMNRSKR